MSTAMSGSPIRRAIYIGKMDPKTGKIKEFAVPELKTGYPVGLLDIEEDKAGDFWSGMMFQGALAKFDPKQKNSRSINCSPITTTSCPTEYAWACGMTSTEKFGQTAPDQELYRLDIKTGTYERFQAQKQQPDKGPFFDLRHSTQIHTTTFYFSDYQKQLDRSRRCRNRKVFVVSRRRLRTRVRAA